MKKTGRRPADEEAFRKRLGAKGLKVTAQRLAVHGAMSELIHGSADAVYEMVRDKCRIRPSTVYNILSELADNGIYGRRFSANNKMYFDVFPDRHVHLYDIRNNAIFDVEAGDLAAQVEAGLRRRRFRGYKIEGIDIQIVCHQTRKKYL